MAGPNDKLIPSLENLVTPVGDELAPVHSPALAKVVNVRLDAIGATRIAAAEGNIAALQDDMSQAQGDIEQLYTLAGTPPPLPDPGGLNFTVSVPENQLTATVSLNANFNASRIFIQKTTDPAPTLDTQGDAVAFTGFSYQLVASTGFGTQDIWYAYAYDEDALQWVKGNPTANNNGSGGFSITPVKTQPDAIADFVIDGETASAFDIGFTAPTISGTVTVSLFMGTYASSTLVASDVNDGDTITGLDGQYFLKAVNDDDPTKFSVSNYQTATLATVVAITSATISNPSVGALNDATLDTLVCSAEPDNYFVTYNDPQQPYIDDARKYAWPNPGFDHIDTGSPIALPALSAYGPTVVRLYVEKDGLISAAYSVTVTATPSAGTTAIQFDSDGATYTNAQSPIIEIPYSRVGDDNDISATINVIDLTSGLTAKRHVDFKYPGSVAFIAAGSNSATLKVPIIKNDIPRGENRQFKLVLSDATGVNAVLGSQVEYTVTITGTDGFHTAYDSENPDVDWNVVEKNQLPIINPQTLTLANSTTIGPGRIDLIGTGLNELFIASKIGVRFQNVDFERAPHGFIRYYQSQGGLIRNCRAGANNLEGATGATKHAFNWEDSAGGGNGCLNCVFVDSAGAMKNWDANATDGHRYNYNTVKSMVNRAALAGTPNAINMIGFQLASGTTGAEIINNIFHAPFGTHVEDIINTYRSRFTSGDHLKVCSNRMLGSQDERQTDLGFSSSGVALQIGDVGTSGNRETGYIDVFDNRVLDAIHSALDNSAGHDIRNRRNKFFNPADRPALQPTYGVQLGIRRQGDAIPGQMYNIEASNNEINTYYRDSSGVVRKLNSSIRFTTGRDGLSPNVAVSSTNLSEGEIIGWDDSQTNVYTVALWEQTGLDGIAGHAGYDYLWEKLVDNASQDNTLPGLVVLGANLLHPTGPGTLFFDQSAGTARWKGYGEVDYGEAVDIASDGTREYPLHSANDDYVINVRVDPSLLPAGDVTLSTYVVTSLILGPHHRYAGPNGDYTGMPDPVTPPVGGSTNPSTPANLTGSANSDGTNSLSWDPSTPQIGYNIVGYEVWRERTSAPTESYARIATVDTTEYTDNDPLLVAGEDYDYQVRAIDDAVPANASAFSSELSLSVYDSTPSNTVPNGEMNTLAEWTASTGSRAVDVSIDPVDGLYKIIMSASATQAGYITDQVPVDASSTYDVYVGYKRSATDLTAKAGRIAIDATSAGAYTGDMANDSLSVQNDTVQEAALVITTGGAQTTCEVTLWLNSSSNPGVDYIKYDYVRFVKR